METKGQGGNCRKNEVNTRVWVGKGPRMSPDTKSRIRRDVCARGEVILASDAPNSTRAVFCPTAL